ncbi:hypothetical protein AB0D30_26065 [Streptomyces sp. NPDC048409]|uniref:hypothetical protein n=1 Tax=Streptomyces sp. NPDC048409 TaxID=3154723 RepID=UPI003445A10C
MDDLLSKVLDLQPSWTAANTEQMKERGVVVRQYLPDLLRQDKARLTAALGVPPVTWVSRGVTVRG